MSTNSIITGIILVGFALVVFIVIKRVFWPKKPIPPPPPPAPGPDEDEKDDGSGEGLPRT